MPYTAPGGFETYFKEWEDKIGAFIEYEPGASLPVSPDAASAAGGVSPDAASAAAALKGLPFAVKDNICVEGFHVSCGSRLLAGVKAPYTATAAAKLLAAGCVPAGKTNLDEFGMGSSTDNSAIKKTNNPWDLARVPGGSSGGSAAAVAAGLVPFALGSDTGGSIRQPAAFCGVVGLKPGYGAVSRYGLVAYASSLEGIGVLSDTVGRSRDVFALIRGADPLDQTSHNPPAGAPSLYGGGTGGTRGTRSTRGTGGVIGVLKTGEELEAETRKGFETAKRGLEDLGYTLKEIEIPSLKYVTPAYYTIATAEASANLARFDGIRYGRRPDWAENPDDLIDKAREAGFGPEVKLRILLGTFVLRSGFQDRYYLRSQRIRAGIKRHFENLLGDSGYAGGPGEYDAILMPVFPTRAFGRGDGALSPFAQKAADLYTCCANLAGLPALSFPASVEGGLPVGVQLVGRAFAEATLLDIAEAYEKAHPFARPAGYRAFWP